MTFCKQCYKNFYHSCRKFAELFLFLFCDFPEVSIQVLHWKACLKNSTKFTRKHLSQSLFSRELWKNFQNTFSTEHLRAISSRFRSLDRQKFVLGLVFNNVKRHICADSNNPWTWIVFTYFFAWYVVGLGKAYSVIAYSIIP